MKPFLKATFAFALVTAGLAAVWGAGQDFYAGHKKPGSALIELCGPVAATTSATIAPDPKGKPLRLPCNCEAVLKVTSAPSGGSPQLNVWYQHSADEGQTWQDWACVNATGTGTYYVPLSTVVSGWNPVNLVNFETGDFSQCASQTNAALVTNPVMDGTYCCQLNRNNSVANVEIRRNGATYYNLPTAYYRFLFEFTSNPAEGGIVNFQDTASGYKCALHLSAGNQLLFYDNAGTLKATGHTVLSSGKVYTLDAKIGTGTSAPWEVRINSVIEMSGTANLGTANNGSIKIGGNVTYTDTYYFDDVAIDGQAYPGLSPLSDGALASNVAVQGAVGNHLRIKFSTIGGTSGFWAFQPFVQPCFCGHR